MPSWRRNAALGAISGLVGAALGAAAVHWWWRWWYARACGSSVAVSEAPARSGVLELIGHTPMVELRSLSRATGCRVLAKCEFLNPGGSTKDRAALFIIQDALAAGKLAPDGTIYEGTSGSTGISLALVARALGLGCRVFMPSDQAIEKALLLRALGADVVRVPPVAIADAGHYVKRAAAAAAGDPRGFFANQFENESNVRAHYTTTGPEIWAQCGGVVHAFVTGAGTGGTLTGVARALRERNAHVRVVLADVPGSVLFWKVKHGVAYTREQDEGARRRNQVDTLVDGIGLGWVCGNTREAVETLVDDAFRVTDQETVWMARHLQEHDALFVGSSSAVNCVAAVRAARALGPGHTVVTVLCDSGTRALSKLWSDEFLAARNLQAQPPVGAEPLAWLE